MIRYIVKRLILIIPVIIGISIIIFCTMKLSPGDPVNLILGPKASEQERDSLRHELGLDKSMPAQYFSYMGNVFKGDFGLTYTTRRPVIEEFKVKFPVTLKLTVYSMIIALVLGIPIGILSAVKPYSIFDKIFTLITLAGTSIPVFWLGLMFILFFSLQLGILPSNGIRSWQGYILPSLTLASASLTYLIRIMRSSMLEVLREDYIRTARSKGVRNNTIVMKHALNNALIPVVTTAGMQMGYNLGGAVLTETVFALPGLGRYMLSGIRSCDLNIVMGSCLILAVTFSLVNLLVDIVYAFLDPRIKAQYRRNVKVKA